MLLENGAEVDTRDREGNTALHGAACWNNEALAKLLIERSANINSPVSHFFCPKISPIHDPHFSTNACRTRMAGRRSMRRPPRAPPMSYDSCYITAHRRLCAPPRSSQFFKFEIVYDIITEVCR